MNYLARCWSFHPKPVFRLLAVLAGLTISLAAADQARATGGPENVLLVVNPRSPDSLCIANHYAALRHIPPNNFLFLDWDPKQENTDVDTFREKILLPVLRAAKLPHSRPADRLRGLLQRLPLGHSHRRGYQEIQGRAGETGARGKDGEARRQVAGLDDLRHARCFDQWADLSVGAGDDQQLLCPPAMQLVRPHRSAGTGQGTDLGVLQRHGLRSPWRGGNRSGTPLLAVDDAGRDGRPRQYAGGSAQLSEPQRGGRRHASPGHHLLRAKRRHSLQGPPGRISRRGEKAEGPGRCGGDPRGQCAGRKERRSRGDAGRGGLRLEGVAEHDLAGRHLRALHQLRRRHARRRRPDAAFRIAPLRGRGRQRHGDRTLRHRHTSFPRP